MPPTARELAFDKPVDDPSLCFLNYEDGKMVRVGLPAIGETRMARKVTNFAARPSTTTLNAWYSASSAAQSSGSEYQPWSPSITQAALSYCTTHESVPSTETLISSLGP